jgi:hypothetical protein
VKALVTSPTVYAVVAFLRVISHRLGIRGQQKSSPSVSRILVMADSVHTRWHPLSE